MLTQQLSENWREWPIEAKARYLERLRRTPSLCTKIPIPPPDEFIARHVTIEDPQAEPSLIPFHPWPAQRELLADIHAERQLIILKARQLGISWLIIAYAVWLCIHHDNQTVLMFSKDGDAATEMIRRARGVYNRLVHKPVGIVKDNTELVEFSNGSRIKSFASTTSAGASFTATLVVWDEAARTAVAEELYTAIKPTIDDGGRIIVLSTARGTGNPFERLYRSAERSANRFAPRFLPWQARPTRNQAWYDAVAADAISLTHHQREYPATADEAFQNISAEAFLPSMSWWDACYEVLPPLTLHEPMVVGVDAGVSGDSFAVVAVTRHPHRPGDVAVRHVQEWRPINGVIDFNAEGGPMQTLRALISSWDVAQIAYDPFQLHAPMTDLRNEGAVFVSEFSQGSERLEADKQLLDLIMQRRIAHPGDATLRRHVENADRKVDSESRRLRIVKREQALKIDCAVALSMAAYRCLKLSL